MIQAGGVSRRTKAIYDLYYADRVSQRCENLYRIFVKIAEHVDAAGLGLKIDIDLLLLAELARSYFLDVIRYKEYHLDFRNEAEAQQELPTGVDAAQLEKLDPLGSEWAEAVHLYSNLNASKVAAYTVKWILKYKPISVIGNLAIELNGSDGVHEQPSFIADINEQYALQCALSALEIDSGAIPANVLDELIYCFRFRSFDEGAYFMLLSEQYLCGGVRDR